MENTDLSRRRFLRQAAAAALFAGVTIQILGCTSESSGGTGPGGDETPGVTGGVSLNHGHTAVVTGAQLDAGGAITLDIQGSSPHNHTVALSAQEMENIKAGTTVSKTSSNSVGHTHAVTFN